jgi:hypothetical protein
MQLRSITASVAWADDAPLAVRPRRPHRRSTILTAALIDRPHVESTLAGAVVGGLVSFSIAYFCH